jgi:hypothetical protein
MSIFYADHRKAPSEGASASSDGQSARSGEASWKPRLKQTRQRDRGRLKKDFMKTIQPQTTQTIPGLASMKLPSLTLISRLVSLAAIVSIVAAPPQSARAQAPGGVGTGVDPTAALREAYGKLPLSFEANHGRGWIGPTVGQRVTRSVTLCFSIYSMQA